MFNNEAVKPFSLRGDDNERSFMLTLLHYENDNDFVIKLFPKICKTRNYIIQN